MESEARVELRLTVRGHDLLTGFGNVGRPTAMLTWLCPFDFSNNDPQNAYTPFDVG